MDAKRLIRVFFGTAFWGGGDSKVHRQRGINDYVAKWGVLKGGYERYYGIKGEKKKQARIKKKSELACLEEKGKKKGKSAPNRALRRERG